MGEHYILDSQARAFFETVARYGFAREEFEIKTDIIDFRIPNKPNTTTNGGRVRINHKATGYYYQFEATADLDLFGHIIFSPGEKTRIEKYSPPGQSWQDIIGHARLWLTHLKRETAVMTNIARSKKVVEDNVRNASVVTNGETSGYTFNSGFAYFEHPGTLTVDLENQYEIRCIRFLLWDGLGEGGTEPHKRRYRYRLATSSDNSHWKEWYSSPEQGAIGWQIFNFTEPIETRYIRIYGLHNTTNKEFHVVELEAYDGTPERPSGFIGAETKIGIEALQVTEDELGRPSSQKIDSASLNKIIKSLEESPIDPVLVENIRLRFEDLVVLDQNLQAIRREIVGPVTNEMQKSNKLALIALTLTIIGLILTFLFSTVGGRFVDWLTQLFTS